MIKEMHPLREKKIWQVFPTLGIIMGKNVDENVIEEKIEDKLQMQS